VSASKSRLAEQPVPKALGPKSQLLAPHPQADQRYQLERWVGLLVGEENVDCAIGIIEALLVLAEDVIRLADAVEAEGGVVTLVAAMDLTRDIVNVALTLPPKCLDDKSMASNFSRVYEIMQLARGIEPDPLTQTIHPDQDPGLLEAHQRIVELIQKIPDMEILEKYPGLAEQVTDTLLQVVKSGDLDTQADIIVTLLSNDALRELDEALNKTAAELPGAGFIGTLNDYDNQLGIDIIPDNVVGGPAIDLVIRTAGVTGLVSSEDTQLLLNLTNLLRGKVSGAAERSTLDRVKSFVQILMQTPEIEPEELPAKPIRLNLDPEPEGIQLREQKEVARWKVLAGIQ